MEKYQKIINQSKKLYIQADKSRATNKIQTSNYKKKMKKKSPNSTKPTTMKWKIA